MVERNQVLSSYGSTAFSLYCSPTERGVLSGRRRSSRRSRGGGGGGRGRCRGGGGSGDKRGGVAPLALLHGGLHGVQLARQPRRAAAGVVLRHPLSPLAVVYAHRYSLCMLQSTTVTCSYHTKMITPTVMRSYRTKIIYTGTHDVTAHSQQSQTKMKHPKKQTMIKTVVSLSPCPRSVVVVVY
jgi:hypothetical protein